MRHIIHRLFIVFIVFLFFFSIILITIFYPYNPYNNRVNYNPEQPIYSDKIDAQLSSLTPVIIDPTFVVLHQDDISRKILVGVYNAYETPRTFKAQISYCLDAHGGHSIPDYSSSPITLTPNAKDAINLIIKNSMKGGSLPRGVYTCRLTVTSDDSVVGEKQIRIERR